MIIYKTTNIINNKIYVGKDSKNDENYIGSGKILKQAIKKYGKENFIKEILCECESEKELNEMEIYWIKKLNSLNRDIGYNIAEGGMGGDTITNNPDRESFLEKKRGKVPWNKGLNISQEQKNKIRDTKLKYFEENPDKKVNSGTYKSGKNHPFYGKKRDPEIYKKIIETRRNNDNYKNVNPVPAQEAVMKAIIIENIETGEITEYKSISEASKKMNMPRISLTSMLRKLYKTDKRRKYKKYNFYYKEDYYKE